MSNSDRPPESRSRRSIYGPDPKYDWLRIFDGEMRRYGADDFVGSPGDFGRQVRRAAKRYGVTVKVITRTQPLPAVWVQKVEGKDDHTDA